MVRIIKCTGCGVDTETEDNNTLCPECQKAERLGYHNRRVLDKATVTVSLEIAVIDPETEGAQ